MQSELGEHATAHETALAALQACRESGNRANESNMLRLLATTELNVGLPDKAETSATLDYLGTLVRERDPVSARRRHVHALRMARALANTALEAQSWEGIGRAFVASGNIALATFRLRHAATLYGRIGANARQEVEALLRELSDGDHDATHH